MKLFLPVSILFVLNIAIRWIYYYPYPPLWDAATYVAMGKYLFSAGQVGFMESFRPVLWPALLGLSWKLGLNPILCGQIWGMLATVGNDVLLYFIGRHVYSNRVALFGAVLLTFSPTFLFWGQCGYPDLLVSFLGLLLVLCFLKNQYRLAGILGGLAVFTKFTAVLLVVLIGISIVYQQRAKKNTRAIGQYSVGFFLVIAIFLAFYQMVLGDLGKSFFEAKVIYGQTPHIWFKEIGFCLKMLFRVEGFIFLAIPLSILGVWREKSYGRWLVIAIGIVSFLWVGKLPTYLDLPRYFIPALPFLYLLAADGVLLVARWLQQKNLRLLICILYFGVGVVTMHQFYLFLNARFPQKELSPMQKYVSRYAEEIKGPVWISDPRSIVYADIKVDELMYYPVFTMEKVQQLRRRLPMASIIFLDSRALNCPLEKDPTCEQAKWQLVEEIKQNFQTEYWEESPDGVIVYGVFKRK